MEAQTLQTEMATNGYGFTMVKYWEAIQKENPDFIPCHICQWRQVWRAAAGVREDIRQEAAKHLILN